MHPHTRVLVPWLPVLVTALATQLQAQPFRDDELLVNGQSAYDNTQCVKVGEFLFAYTLRDTPAFRTDGKLRDDIHTMLKWCEDNSTVAAGGKGDCMTEECKKARKRPIVNLRFPPPQVTAVETPQRRAHIYAALAVAQNQVNVANRCGFSGNRWDSDYNRHFRWCLDVVGEVCRAETHTRQAMLHQCGG